MKKHTMPEMKEGGVNVTPLIDIVMCLIIFFMLVAKIGVVTGAEEDIEPPSTILGVRIKDIGNTVILNIRKTPGDEPLVTAMVEKNAKGPKEVKLLLPNGDRPLQRALTAAKAENKNLKVIILGERDVPYHQLEQVLMTVSLSGIREMNFKTQQTSLGGQT